MKKMLFLFFLLIGIYFPCVAFATKAFQFKSSKMLAQKGQHTTKKNIHNAYKDQDKLSYATIYPGSLRWNIEHIAREYGWDHLVWKVSEDYRWVGNTRISGHGLTGILEKLLKSYPLQANFYLGNHVLVIVPRTLR